MLGAEVGVGGDGGATVGLGPAGACSALSEGVGEGSTGGVEAGKVDGAGSKLLGIGRDSGGGADDDRITITCAAAPSCMATEPNTSTEPSTAAAVATPTATFVAVIGATGHRRLHPSEAARGHRTAADADADSRLRNLWTGLVPALGTLMASREIALRSPPAASTSAPIGP
jgi:hypothetical protein